MGGQCFGICGRENCFVRKIDRIKKNDFVLEVVTGELKTNALTATSLANC
jgi:hypothetical protein